MKQYILIILSIFFVKYLYACDYKPLSVGEGYDKSSEVVLGKILKKELKFYVIDSLSKDSIQSHYERLVINDTIRFVEYTVQIIKNFKDTQIGKELVVRAEARRSNCDIKLKPGSTYILYGYNNSWTNIFYPKDKYFILTSICTRTTNSWKNEQKELEKYIRKKE